MKKVILLPLLVALFQFTNAALGQTYTIPAGSGTLTYTVTLVVNTCHVPVPPINSPYYSSTFRSFAYTASGVTTQLPGTAFSITGPGATGRNGCPKVSNFQTFVGVAPIEAPNTGIAFTPSYTTYYAGTATAYPAGILYPAYFISSILYAPPGNKSSAGYTDTTTYATTTSTGSSFTVGDTVTYTEGQGIFGVGGTESFSFGTSTTNGNTTAFTTSISQASGVSNNSVATNPNAINHQQDEFLLWLNPEIVVIQTGATTVDYFVGTQIQTSGDPNPGQPEVVDTEQIVASVLTASSTNGGLTTVPLSLLEPQTVEQNGQIETLPGLASVCANPLPVSQCKFDNQCGCAPSDFQPILNADPLLGLASADSPMSVNLDSSAACTNPASGANCRFVPIMLVNNGEPTSVQVNVRLEGPDCSTCDPTPNTFVETDQYQITTTLTGSYSLTEAFSWQVGWDEMGSGVGIKDSNQWTWTYSQSSGETNSAAHTMSVNLQSATVGCDDPGVTVYEDTVYHTFAFQQTPGNTSCP